MQVTYKVIVDVDTDDVRKAKALADEYINDVLESGIDMANELECDCIVALQQQSTTTYRNKAAEIIRAFRKDKEETEYDASVNQCLNDFYADGLSISEAFKVYMLVKHAIEGCRYFQKYPDEGLFEFNFKEKDGWFDGETDVEDANVIATY